MSVFLCVGIIINMKKSELRTIIREVIQQITEAPISKITPKEKKAIAKQLGAIELLQGLGRVSGPEKALTYVMQALDAAGFQLDMTQYDMFRGDSGTKLLTFSRPATNPNEDETRVENSRISYSWYMTGFSRENPLDKKFEITVYVT